MRYNPACAGTTLRSRTKSIWCTIQPRVCGDYSVLLRLFSIVTDTTPRVRGLQTGRINDYAVSRYNPACAGTTIRAFLSAAELEIQPRVCGDYDHREFRCHRALDTTPRVRGLQRAPVCTVPRRRYNPACAGTTRSLKHRRGRMTIQPRVCGDYAARSVLNGLAVDTTPRVRGLRKFDGVGCQHIRYNPACAGTTIPE